MPGASHVRIISVTWFAYECYDIFVEVIQSLIFAFRYILLQSVVTA